MSRMCGAIPPLPQYAFKAWCSVKAQGQLYLLPLPLPHGHIPIHVNESMAHYFPNTFDHRTLSILKITDGNIKETVLV